MVRVRFGKLIPALVLGLTLVSACGGAAMPLPGAAPQVQGIAADKTVSVGAFMAQSGPLASAGNVGLGAKLYLDMTNAAGGVNGYQFKYTLLDDAADPTKTVTSVKQLWEQEKVFALLLPYGSSPNNAAKQYILSSNIPTLFPYANSDIYFPAGGATPKNVFGFQSAYVPQVVQLVEFAAKQKGVKKIAVLHTTDDYGQSGADGAQAAAKQLGVEVVATVGYDLTETNFAPFGQRIASSGADAVIAWGIAGMVQAMTATRQAGFNGVFLASDIFRGGFFQDQLVKIPDVQQKTYIIYHQKIVPQMPQGANDFLGRFKSAYPNGDPVPALTGWSGAAMFVTAVREATANNKPLTWDNLRAALETWQNRDIEAAVGVSYSASGHIGATKSQILLLGSDNQWQVAQDFTTLPTVAK